MPKAKGRGRPKTIYKGTFENISNDISAGLSNSIGNPNLFNYEPHKKQILFHKNEKKGRLYVGGNRSGKTTAGIIEDLQWLTNRHPYRNTPEPPVFGRVLTVDFNFGVSKIILPLIRRWLPNSYLINGSWEDSYSPAEHTLTLSNNSQLEIMSYEQDIEKFAGVPRHFTHFDEEPPHIIYKECLARLVDYRGSWWMTMTPVDGMTWTYEDIYLQEGDLINVTTVDILDNPYLDPEAVEEFLSGYSEEEQKIRGGGQYIALGGLIFKTFDAARHVIEPAKPPRNWLLYESVDHGFSNPTAWLWHVVSPEGTIVTFDEHYKSEMTVEQHANIVKEKEKAVREQLGMVPYLRIGDPAMEQRQATTGHSIRIEYALNDLNLVMGRLKNVEAGLDRMNNYFNNNKWFITSNCVNFIKEVQKYRYKDYVNQKIADRSNKMEGPLKKDDHACDSARYFMSFMPDLTPHEQKDRSEHTKQKIEELMGNQTPINPYAPFKIDPNFSKDTKPYPVVIDDTLGGEW